MLSTFLFDLDGTLLDSKKPFIIAYNRALAKNALPPLPAEESSAIRILRQPADKILMDLIDEKKALDPRFVEAFTEDLREAYGEVYAAHTSLSPFAKDVIVALKSNSQKIGIVTSRFSFADYIVPALNQMGVGKHIDIIVTSHDVVSTKPSPEPFLLAAEKLGKGPEECVVIGDSPEDILAGKAAGMLTIAYTGGFYGIEELSRYDSDFMIDDLRKLLALVNNPL